MLSVPVEIRKSSIHGFGVFAARDIDSGSVVWQFTPGLDRVVADYALKHAEPHSREYVMERGFINPTQPDEWVVCVDEAQFMNFPRHGEDANTILGGMLDGQYLLLASVNIPAGTEITVPPESDFDYTRKLSLYEPGQ
jgi:hypothetical protein